MILTKQEAVESYGSEKCKEHFEKYGRFKSKEIENALIKTLEQNFDVVEKIKDGRSYSFKLEGKKKTVGMRVDNRISNGKWSGMYTKNMDIMVVSVLAQELFTELAQSLNKWCLDFGLITPKMYDLLPANHNEYRKIQCVEELINNNIIQEGEERIINDYLYGFKELKGQLAGTLNRMAKAGIIEYYPVFKGHVKGTSEIINLHESVVNRILQEQERVMEKHEVNDWYLNQFRYSQKTKDYHKEWKEKLLQFEDVNGQVLELEYFYKRHVIILKATKKKIIRYLEKYNKEAIEKFKQDEQLFINENKAEYHEKRNQYVYNEHKKKEDEFLNNGSFMKINTTFDEGYYELYFSRLYAQRIKELQEYYGYTFE